MRIYLAARYTRRLELCEYKAQLEELGCTVTSRWLNGSHQISNLGVPIGDSGELLVEKGDRAAREMCEHFAKEDRADVYAADIVIAFTEEPRSGHSRGGRHVELGLAIARGKRIYIVGPRENVFCWLPELTHFSTWEMMRGEILRWTASTRTSHPNGSDEPEFNTTQIPHGENFNG
jgi:hypothetical protein